MMRMSTSKDPSLLSDTEWDVSVKKKQVVWKTWVRFLLFFFLILVILATTIIFIFGIIYRHDFLGFIKFKPHMEPTSHALIDEYLQAGTIQMTTRLFSGANSNGNTVWSPLTVALGLSLLLEGTTGQTAHEIKSGMGWIGVDRSYIRSHISQVITRLNNVRGLEAIVANRMFLHNSYDVASWYKNILNEHYQATVDKVDFTNANAFESINRWGLEQSRGQITELIPLGSIDATTKLILSTLLTFNGRWEQPFSPNHTQNADFTLENDKKTVVDMMYLTGRFLYGEFPAHGFIALELPYYDANISMIVLLPKRLSVLKDILEEQDGKMLISIRSKMRKTNVDVCLPKFKVESGNTMERHLSSIGIRRLFNPSSANLNMIAPNSELYVQKIIHRVKIQVDENGASGQASSSSVLQGRSLAPSFCADHPFLFYVEDKETHSILFWGEYNEPE